MVRSNKSFHIAARGIRVAAVAGVVGVAALTAGCSSDSDDSTTPSATATGAGAASSASSTASSTESSDSGDGSASGDLVSWAGDFCGAVRPMVEQLQGFTSAAPTDASDPAALITQYQSLMAAAGPAMADASDAIDGLDAPPIDDGENIKSQMVTLLDQSAAAFDALAAQIATLDPNDPNAFESFGSAMSGIEPDLEKSSEALDKAFEDADMQDAFDEAPACAGLDMGG